MIQNIYPHIFHNEYRYDIPREQDLVFAFRGREILLDREKRRVPEVQELAEEDRRDRLRYLFELDTRSCFLYWDEEGGELSLPGYSYDSIRTLRQDGEQGTLGFAGSTAWQLEVWYRKNVFCGRCGTKLMVGKKERSMVCPSCGNIIYPLIAPAIIAGVTDGDRIVMTRYAGREYKGVALIAGFCEIGETAEDTVRREVMEEVGLHVTNIRYVASQPWGFDSNLLLGFFCDVEGSTQITREEDELAVAEWVERKDIGEGQNLMSLTATMIEMFREGKEK